MAIIDLIAVALMVTVAILVIQNRRGASKAEAPPQRDPDAERLTDEVRELRARIQVLERVITDNHGSDHLANEIDRLRDR